MKGFLLFVNVYISDKLNIISFV